MCIGCGMYAVAGMSTGVAYATRLGKMTQRGADF